MFELFDPEQVSSRARRDAGRALRRVQNGLRLVNGEPAPRPPSPADVVWGADKVRVLRYSARTPTTSAPVVIVHSLVTRSYVFDLAPGHSLIEALNGRGFNVYLVDWGVPDGFEAANTIETYADDYLPRVVDAVVRTSRAEHVHLLGYCLGGVLTLLYLAARRAATVSSAVVMATPVDFDQLGPLSTLLQPGRLDPDDVIDGSGNVPPAALMRGFAALRPTGPLNATVTLLQNLWDDDYVAGHQMMSGWASDHVPFPGAAFTQVAELLIRRNILVSGTFPLGGRDVSLSDIATPLLSVVGEDDHIVPPRSSEALGALVGSPGFRRLCIPAGHAGLFVGTGARRHLVPALAHWFSSHPR